jgi:hypothetical protein
MRAISRPASISPRRASVVSRWLAPTRHGKLLERSGLPCGARGRAPDKNPVRRWVIRPSREGSEPPTLAGMGARQIELATGVGCHARHAREFCRGVPRPLVQGFAGIRTRPSRSVRRRKSAPPTRRRSAAAAGRQRLSSQSQAGVSRLKRPHIARNRRPHDWSVGCCGEPSATVPVHEL